MVDNNKIKKLYALNFFLQIIVEIRNKPKIIK